eukprot:UN03506
MMYLYGLDSKFTSNKKLLFLWDISRRLELSQYFVHHVVRQSYKIDDIIKLLKEISKDGNQEAIQTASDILQWTLEKTANRQVKESQYVRKDSQTSSYVPQTHYNIQSPKQFIPIQPQQRRFAQIIQKTPATSQYGRYRSRTLRKRESRRIYGERRYAVT